MTGSYIALVICLTVLGAIGIPVLLYLGLRGGGPLREAEFFRRAFNAARSPWKQEDENLAELSRRVDRLNRKGE